MMKSTRKRATFSYDMSIQAPAEKIFPLLCPVREFEWIPHWDCQLLFSESSYAELGCVFSTNLDETFGREIWVVSRYQPDEMICFVRSSAKRTTRFSITLTPAGPDKTKLIWEQEMTALDDKGDALISGIRPSAFREQMTNLEDLLSHYLEHGVPLRPDMDISRE